MPESALPSLFAAHWRATCFALLVAVPLAVWTTATAKLYGSYRPPEIAEALWLALPIGLAGRALAFGAQRLWLSLWLSARRRNERALPPPWAIALSLVAVDAVTTAALLLPAFGLAIVLYFTYASGAMTLLVMPIAVFVGPATARALRHAQAAQATAQVA